MAEKDDSAWAFLQELQTALNEIKLSEVREWLGLIHNDYEGQFLTKFVHPTISTFLKRRLEPQRAREAFLTESTKARECGIASDTPASADRHLFTKVLGMPAKTLVDLWWGNDEKNPFSQSCPDFAFRTPCDYRVVFEGKLFRKGGVDAAKTDLVKGIYQCFYYRGQPKVPGKGKKPGWDYDYACLVAYDASESRSLVTAWIDKANKIQKDAGNPRESL